MKIYRKITCICTIIGVILVSFNYSVQPSQAVGVGEGIRGLSCVSGGLLAPELKNAIDRATQLVRDKVKEIFKKVPGPPGFPRPTLDPSISIGLSVPVDDAKTQAKIEQFKEEYKGKEILGDIIARCTARQVLNTMVSSILNIARTSGRNGGPAYVRNWRNFQTDAQYRGENIFRAMLSNTKLCNYFDRELKNLFGANKKTALPGQNTRVNNSDSFALRNNCTLPSNFDMKKYQSNFSQNGGWEAWSRLLEPQNNFYGALFQSLDEMATQRTTEELADINEAVSGRGFTSKRGNDAKDGCKVMGMGGTCLVYKDIKTPGIVIGEAVSATMEQELAWVTNVDELSEMIEAATNLILNRLVDLSNPNEGDHTLFTDPDLTVSPPPIITCNMVSTEDGATARYENDARVAVQEYLDANPEVANSSKNDQAQVDQFLEGTAEVLRSKGFMSGRAINCNNNVSKGSIIVARQRDAYGDYLDMIRGQEDGQDATIAERAQASLVEWAGVERLVGVSEGN